MVFLWERGCNPPQRLEVHEKSYPYGMEGRDDKTLPTGWIFMKNHTLNIRFNMLQTIKNCFHMHHIEVH